MNFTFLIVFVFSGTIMLICSLYPLFSYFRSLFFKKKIQKSEEFLVPVSIVIAAFNEEIFIRGKIEFFLNEEEWIPGSELIVISAGSTDRTNDILLEYSNNPHVKILIIEEHLLKTQALNRAVAHCKNDILIFSDCRQTIRPGSIKNLVNYFNDPEIGTVNSTLLDNKNGGKTSLIRRIMNAICLNESISGSSLNLHGALYAQRRSLFRNFPEDVFFDDLFASVSTLVQGKRLIQAKDSIIYDIHFHKYFQKNRIERNAKGAIMFLGRYWHLIKQLPSPLLFRFMIFRYFKLFFPLLSFGFTLSFLSYFAAPSLIKEILSSLILCSPLLFVNKIREFMMTMLRVNFYFSTALFKYFFLRKREMGWEKLSKEQLVFAEQNTVN